MKNNKIYKATLCLALLVSTTATLCACSSSVKANNVTKQQAVADVNVTTVRVHYYSGSAADYDAKALWLWVDGGEGAEYTFDGEDAYGVYADYDFSAAAKRTFCVIVKSKGSWTTQTADMKIDIPTTSSSATYDIYLVEGMEQIYTSEIEAKQPQILSSKFSDKNKISVSLLDPGSYYDGSQEKVSVYADGEPINIVGFECADNKNLVIEVDPNDVDISKNYSVKIAFSDTVIKENSVDITFFYDSDEFKQKYTYYGNDLGVSFNEKHTRTTFKVWAPISSKVLLRTYTNGTPVSENKDLGSDQVAQEFEMHKEQQGVWSITLDKNMHGMYYTYVVTNGNSTHEVVDPYAKSCGINGKRGCVVDFDSVNQEIGWSKVKRPTDLKSESDQIIYEMHVRDMTDDTDSGIKDATFNGKSYEANDVKGKWLALSQEGTKTSSGLTTGIDHIKELGVNTVQIQPFYDYSSVDETKDVTDPSSNYNWGYDPVNYNCLEGSYSLDPYNGIERIKEFKTAMKTFCKNKIHVNMDVVFNHTSASSDTNFEYIVPGYYHRRTADGSFSNGSGCGNEMASERPMCRKFIVDSCKFWMSEYNLSGFRFDLMQLLDTETMSEVASECKKIYPQAAVYGEPWSGGTSTTTYTGVNQGNLAKVNGVGAFNDKIRNAVRGENGKKAKGWINGESKYGDIISGIQGRFSGSIPMDASKVINYVSCHDNYTLYDQIHFSSNNSNEYMKNSQAMSICMFAEGVPFFQEGDEFLRSKDDGITKNPGNTYKEGNPNVMHYNMKSENLDVYQAYQNMISIRKKYPGLRLATNDEVQSAVSIDKSQQSTNSIYYTVTYNNQTLYIIHAGKAGNFDLGDSYKLVYSNDTFGRATGETMNSISLNANESVVLVK